MKKSIQFLTPIVIALFFISSLVSCNEVAKEAKETVVTTTLDLVKVKIEIENANKELSTLFAVADSTGISNLFTSDAKFMLTGVPAITGTKNIESTFSGLFKSGLSNISINTIEVWGTEDLIIEEGEYSLFVGEKKVDNGKLIVLWKKEDGKWKLFRDIFNSNLSPQ